jgi:hypothetical protein
MGESNSNSGVVVTRSNHQHSTLFSRVSRERQALSEIFEIFTLLEISDVDLFDWQQTMDTIAKISEDRVVISLYEAYHSISNESDTSQVAF